MTRRERPEDNRARPSRERAPEPVDEPVEKFGDESEEEEAPPAWLQKAAERHEERQRKYASLFNGARESVEKGREELSGLLDRVSAQSEGEEESEPPPPSLFDEASREYQERQKSLGGLFSDAVKARQQEKEALMKMFERPKGKKGPPGKR